MSVALSGQIDFSHGEWLAYVRGGNIWVEAFPNGVAYQVSQRGNASSPMWTTDGRLTFLQDGNRVEGFPAGTISSASADRALIERALGVSESRKVADFSLSPNGRLFAANVVTHESNAPTDRQGHLIVLNTDGSNAREVFTAGKPNALQIATWSSDSEHILVWIDPDFSASLATDGLALVSVPAVGGPVVRLFDHVLTYSDFLSVSPYQSRILVVSGFQRDAWTEKRLMLVDPATGQTTPLSDEKSAIAAAAWSPDGTRIAYVSSPDNRHVKTATVVRPNGQRVTRQFIASGDQSNLPDRRLWIMNADGRDKRQLTNDPQYRDEHPQWSRDGRYIVFTRLDKQGHASIWAVDALNGNVSQVVSSIDSPGAVGYYGHLDWPSYVAWFSH